MICVTVSALLALVIQAQPGGDCSECALPLDNVGPGTFWCEVSSTCEVVEKGEPVLEQPKVYEFIPVSLEVVCTESTIVTISGTYSHTRSRQWEIASSVGYESGTIPALVGKIKAELTGKYGGGSSATVSVTISESMTFSCSEGKVTGAVNFYSVRATQDIESRKTSRGRWCWFDYPLIPCNASNCPHMASHCVYALSSGDCLARVRSREATCKPGQLVFEQATLIALGDLVRDVKDGDCCGNEASTEHEDGSGGQTGDAQTGDTGEFPPQQDDDDDEEEDDE